MGCITSFFMVQVLKLLNVFKSYEFRGELILRLFFPRMPKFARKDKQFRNRYSWFFWAQLTRLLVSWSYNFFTTVFTKVTKKYQWILGLFTPLIKELFIWLFVKLTSKASGSGNNKHTTKLSCIHYVESRHAVFMAIMVGSLLTPLTTYIIIGMDFAINIYKGLEIVYLLKYSKKYNAVNHGKFLLNIGCNYDSILLRLRQ